MQNIHRPDRYIELHLHLDGAITVGIARKLADLQNITLPADDTVLEKQLTVPENCQSLNDFLRCFALPLTLLQTPEGLREAVYLVAEQCREQGVIYTEIRFAPQLHTEQGMTQEDAVLAALEGIRMTPLRVNLILCCMRGTDNAAQNAETLRLARKYLAADSGVVALDLAGAEALFPTSDYRELFAEAMQAGIPFTIHAGEADGADSVREAIRFGAKRIGHGVRASENPEVVQLLKDKGIPLEMCPTSNRQTHAVEDMRTYPFMDYLRQGLCVTLNTDDMAIEGTNLAEEYRYMEETFGLTAEQEQTVLANAVKAAFTTEEVREQLRKELGLVGYDAGI